jgi:hypothetical protein
MSVELVCEVRRGEGAAASGGRLRRVAQRAGAVLVATVGGLLLGATAALAGPIDVGQGTAPPGAGQIKTIVSYLAWGVTAACVAGVLIAAGKMAVAHQRGGGGAEHASSLAWVLIAAVIAGSASALVGAVI